jgi:hypothetical protein
VSSSSSSPLPSSIPCSRSPDPGLKRGTCHSTKKTASPNLTFVCLGLHLYASITAYLSITIYRIIHPLHSTYPSLDDHPELSYKELRLPRPTTPSLTSPTAFIFPSTYLHATCSNGPTRQTFRPCLWLFLLKETATYLSILLVSTLVLCDHIAPRRPRRIVHSSTRPPVAVDITTLALSLDLVGSIVADSSNAPRRARYQPRPRASLPEPSLVSHHITHIHTPHNGARRRDEAHGCAV